MEMFIFWVEEGVFNFFNLFFEFRIKWNLEYVLVIEFNFFFGIRIERIVIDVFWEFKFISLVRMKSIDSNFFF